MTNLPSFLDQAMKWFEENCSGESEKLSPIQNVFERLRRLVDARNYLRKTNYMDDFVCQTSIGSLNPGITREVDIQELFELVNDPEIFDWRRNCSLSDEDIFFIFRFDLLRCFFRLKEDNWKGLSEFSSKSNVRNWVNSLVLDLKKESSDRGGLLKTELEELEFMNLSDWTNEELAHFAIRLRHPDCPVGDGCKDQTCYFNHPVPCPKHVEHTMGTTPSGFQSLSCPYMKGLCSRPHPCKKFISIHGKCDLESRDGDCQDPYCVKSHDRHICPFVTREECDRRRRLGGYPDCSGYRHIPPTELKRLTVLRGALEKECEIVE